jgi:hypothetical protein
MNRNRRKLLIALVLTGLALLATGLVAGWSDDDDGGDVCGCPPTPTPVRTPTPTPVRTPTPIRTPTPTPTPTPVRTPTPTPPPVGHSQASNVAFGKDFQTNWSTITLTTTLNNVVDMSGAGIGNGAGSNYTGPLINIYQNGSDGVTTTIDQKNDFLANWGGYNSEYQK